MGGLDWVSDIGLIMKGNYLIQTFSEFCDCSHKTHCSTNSSPDTIVCNVFERITKSWFSYWFQSKDHCRLQILTKNQCLSSLLNPLCHVSKIFQLFPTMLQSEITVALSYACLIKKCWQCWSLWHQWRSFSARNYDSSEGGHSHQYYQHAYGDRLHATDCCQLILIICFSTMFS